MYRSEHVSGHTHFFILKTWVGVKTVKGISTAEVTVRLPPASAAGVIWTFLYFTFRNMEMSFGIKEFLAFGVTAWLKPKSYTD